MHIRSTTSSQNSPEARELTTTMPRRGGLHCLAFLMLLNFIYDRFELKAVYREFHNPNELQPDTVPSCTEKESHLIDRSWCPEAKCLLTPFCEPCRRRFLIVITNGRSASTTLTWMLDSLPGVRMGGENNNAIHNIMTMIEQTTSYPFRLKPPSYLKYGAWYHNPIPDGSLACVTQKMIETIVPPSFINGTQLDPNESDEIIGFKTIRLMTNINSTEVKNIAQFLNMSFPCARFIINYQSDNAKQAKSQTMVFESQNQEDIDEAVQRIAMEVKHLKNLAELLGQKAMILDSTKWTKDVGELNKAVEWLGFDRSCAFPKLMKLNTELSKPKDGKNATSAQMGINAAFKHTDTKIILDPSCRYVGR